MPHAVESFLKVDEVGEEFTLLLQVFLNDSVEDMFHCAPPSSKSSLPFLCRTLQSIEVYSLA
ncbi:hypothetical protein DPMN_050243 [Dreissena polymorpha]|uniref:Uncharacterized protein n=1 Tax=Dreissena polymorpha TaxID=45954 RepID=A0A9D4CGD9_DREPO|nr:hypothetical protein DPMN_050243 [Dreissena polymorpha]